MSLAHPLPPHNSEESTETLLDTPEKEKLPQLPSPRARSGLNLKSALKFTLVLILAISYLTFCVISHYRNIPIQVGSNGVVDLSFFHFSAASGITTIAILIIYVALWPIKGLVDEIRSEEFFRLLGVHPKGVPLDSINAISVPTTGAFDIALATFHRHCSPLFTSTLVIMFLIAATSVLAPAALNAASISIDVVDPAFQIGAIPKNSYYSDVNGFNMSIAGLFPLASAVSWVENVLNITTTYSRVISNEDDSLGYVVPFPPDYTPAMQAQWTTDIIVFDPSCNWRAPNTTGLADFNSTDGVVHAVIDHSPNAVSNQPVWDADLTLLETNLSIYVSSYDFDSMSAKIHLQIAHDIDGVSNSIVFIISQTPPFLAADLSKVPTLRFSDGSILAFLECSPNASIQTRQVWATGNGSLTLGQHQPIQGNLDLSQVNLLLWYMMSSFESSSGPMSTPVGTDMMIRLIFGNNFQSLLDLGVFFVPLAPLTNITNMYKQVIQSAAKVFVSGKLGVANVTGSRPKDQVVFKSSLGHVIASAILFALLTTGFVVAQFRKGRDAFTLVDVAAALADSDAPQKLVEMKQQADAEERRILRLDQSGKGDWIVRLGASTEE